MQLTFNQMLIPRRGYISPTSSSPANSYLFKVNNRNTRKRCEICSKLTIKTPDELFCENSKRV